MPPARLIFRIRSLVIGIAVTVLGLFGLLGLVVIEDAHRRMSDEAGENLLGYARVVGLAHAQWVDESQVLLGMVAELVRRGEVESGRCTQSLADLLTRARGYDTFLIVGPDGNVWCAPYSLSQPVSVADRAYFKRVVETRRFSSGSYVIGRVSGLPVLPVAYPILSADGRIDHVIVAGKRADWFQNLILTLDIPPGTHVDLVDSNADVLAHYPPQDPGYDLTREVADWAKAAIKFGTSSITEWKTALGEPGIFAVAPIGKSELEMAVVVQQSRTTLVGEIDSFRLKALGLLVAALTVTASLLITVLRRNIQRPIERLAAGTRIIRAGDHSWRADGGAGQTVEMGELFKSFDSMIGDLAAQEIQIRSQAAEVERSNGDLQNFAYMVSHDLREPLRTMKSFIQLFARRLGDQVDEEGREYMRFVTDGADRMSRMLDGILEYSRIETRAHALEPVSLDQPLDQALAALMLALDETGAVVERGPLPTIAGDAEQLTRLFQNLISNALKFRRPDAKPVVRVSAIQQGEFWEIAVADNGVGLPEHGRDQLFQLFRRLVTRDAYPGDGIGLAVCKRIVERHGGTIRVESEAGRGTTMIVTLRAA